MSDLTKLLVSVMLAAGQAVYSLQANAAASAQVPSQAVVISQPTIQLTTASPAALVVPAPPKPDFDSEVLAPLRQAQAEAAAKAAAEAAAKAADEAAARAAAARAAQIQTVSAPVAGSHTDWMSAAGMDPGNYGYIDYIFSHESSWNPWECSPGGRYCGLGQTNPANLAASCPNWQTDPICQIRFFNSYAIGRYGSWARAYSFKVRNGWW